MRLVPIFAALVLAGCPATPEQPPAGGPPAGGAMGPPPGGEAGGPAMKPGEGGPGEGGPAAAEGAEPGAPGEGGPAVGEGPKEPGGPGGPPPEFEIEGEAVKVSGEVTFEAYTAGPIVVEVLRNEEGIAQPIRLHVLQLQGPGPFSFEAPKDLGEINIIAYAGEAEKGPSPESPQGGVPPFAVATEDISGVTITISAENAGDKGKPKED